MIQPGLYGEKQILGAKVRVISSPGYEVFEEKDNSKLYRIKKIEYRITLDGKLSAGIILDGIENKHYSPGELEIIELPVCNN